MTSTARDSKGGVADAIDLDISFGSGGGRSKRRCVRNDMAVLRMRGGAGGEPAAAGVRWAPAAAFIGLVRLPLLRLVTMKVEVPLSRHRRYYYQHR